MWTVREARLDGDTVGLGPARRLALTDVHPVGTSPALGDAPNGKDAAVKSVELFAGAGGLALGTAEAGLAHKVVIEWDADACQTLNVRGYSGPGSAATSGM